MREGLGEEERGGEESTERNAGEGDWEGGEVHRINFLSTHHLNSLSSAKPVNHGWL